MFQTMIGFFGAFVGLSCHLFVSRKHYDFEGAREKARLNGACLQVIAFTSCLLLVIVFFLKGWLSNIFGLPSHVLYLGVLVCSATALIQVRLVCWQVEHHPKSYGLIQVGQALLNFFLSIFLVVILLMASQGRILAQVFSVLIVLIICLRFFYRDRLIKVFFFDPHYLRGILRFGIPLIPHVLGVFLLVTVDRFMINSQLGLGQTGIYMVGVQIAAGLALLFDGLNKAFLPWLYESLKKENFQTDRLVVKAVYTIFIGSIFVGLVLLYLIKGFLPYLIDEQYHSVTAFIGWLLMGQVLAGMYLVLANFIFYSKKTGWLSIVSISCGLLNVVLLVFLLEPYGIEGAAIAFCIAMVFRMLLVWCVAIYRYPMPWFGSFLYKRL